MVGSEFAKLQRAKGQSIFKNMNHTQLCGVQGGKYFAIILQLYRRILNDKKKQCYNWVANLFGPDWTGICCGARTKLEENVSAQWKIGLIPASLYWH